MPISLQFEGGAEAPLEVEGVTPDKVCELTLDEIRRLNVFHGNRKAELGDFFRVEGEPGDEMRWSGDLSGVHWLGAKMACGSIVVDGDVGRHVGSEMSGGSIVVNGNAGDWIGAEMQGGSIHVHGRAGHLVGAAYRGSARGMRAGTILIDGDAGNEVGHTMRRGLIAIGGNIGDLIGFNMLAGTVVIGGEAGIRHGAGMKRGTLAFLGPAPSMLPTFRRACRYQPEAMTLLIRQLQGDGFQVDPAAEDAAYDLYNGDLIEGGRGEVLLRA